MSFEKWARGDSLFHRASPPLKIVAAVFFCFGLAGCAQVPVVLLGLSFAILGVLIARIPLAGLLRRLAMVNLFTLVCWLTLPVTVPGTEVAHLGFVS